MGNWLLYARAGKRRAKAKDGQVKRKLEHGVVFSDEGKAQRESALANVVYFKRGWLSVDLQLAHGRDLHVRIDLQAIKPAGVAPIL